MSRWPRGEAQIEQLIATRQLQQVIGGQANGAHLMQKASRTLETAGEIADQDPDSAYVLAYDAARYSGTAILAHQGLRPTTSGGHYVVEVALRAQFGDGFRPFGAMRRRRNELEYPSRPGETTTIRRGAEGHPRRRGAASGGSAVVAYQFHLLTGTGKQLPEGPLTWESVAHGWSRALWSGPGRRPTGSGVYESPTSATLFVCGACDGNRTRTISLGTDSLQ